MSRTTTSRGCSPRRTSTTAFSLLTGRASWPVALSLTLLALLAGCQGEVGEVDTDSDSAEEGDRRRDAGKNRDGGRKDARAEPVEDDDEDDDDDDVADDDVGDDDTVTPRVTPEAGARSDGGRDGGRDASAPGTSDAAVASDAGDAASGSAGPNTCPDGTARAPAAGLKIREIALYQTVKVPLYSNGSWVSQPSSPVVQGKKAMVRVFVDTQSSYTRRPVRGSLVLTTAGMATEVVDEKTISASSTDADVGSTFTFQVDGAQIGAGTQMSVALEESACGDGGGAEADGTRLPASGAQALTTVAVGKLRMVIVPISVGGRLPTTTPAEVANIKNAMLAYYPVPDVEITVRERPIMWTGTLAGTDNRAWTNMLNQVMRERSTDRPETDVYYFGLVQPAATMQQYCGRGCILGIAPQATRVSSQAQVGLGASFNNAQTYETIVHEVGHAHGRGHAPCVQGGNIAGVDGMFPDRSGGISVWGWDSRSNKLMNPMTTKDIMGYCSPNWISAYTYNALAARGTQVNKRAFVLGGLSSTWRDVILYSDGSARWGGNTESDDPGGDVEQAQVLDASGNVIEEVEVMRVPLSHTDDQLLYVPEPGAKWSSLVLRDRVIALSDVQAPL